MRLAALVVLVGCAAWLVNASPAPLDIKPVDISTLIATVPGLKEELEAKIKKDSGKISIVATATNAPATTAPTTTTSAPQANAPPTPAQTTTPRSTEGGKRHRPLRRRGGRRRLQPNDQNPEETEATSQPRRQKNARTFPQAP
ncbi:uncharacterized protein LOC121871808 [Homarus americanus]|uniref:Uncharacterized protein n=1 Tax=Homarus americanus TaxID=6706 RepID=A0A8J5MUT7_HOMAM|nr:uncharacterized protein LOC121871808 [Homarus americanus]KAG7164421.1 hypothetical protein Hamer_G003623 [Homarus americanus]